jgi:HisJ family histidinol phosphate phosphatase
VKESESQSDDGLSNPAPSGPLAPDPGSLKFDFDYHIHTIYSGHSGPEMFVPAIMARCGELGLRRAMIVEHAPAMMSETFTSFPEWLTGRDDRTATQAILSEVRARRETLPDIEVLVGAEIDADPERMDGSLMLRNLSGLDAVLASTHLLPGGEGFWFSPPEISDAEKPELRERWLAWMENVAANPDVNIIAHPFAEMHNCGLSAGFDAAFRESCQLLLTVMAAQQTAFELNETALRRFTEEDLVEYVELVKLAHECGVRFTAGSDAHRGKQLGSYRLVPEVASRAKLGPDDFWHPPLVASRA